MTPKTGKAFFPAFIWGIIFCCFSCAFCQEDGFEPAQQIEGKYFTLYCAPGVDINNLPRQLNVSSVDNILVGKSKTGPQMASLGEMVDSLFMQVCGILDMRLFSFKGNIKICKDFSQLKEIYQNLFSQSLGRHSFYVYSLNTVYISQEYFKKEVLGHEIAHAVISHYFVVLPSVKVQEVLSMYVEYQLRKGG